MLKNLIYLLLPLGLLAQNQTLSFSKGTYHETYRTQETITLDGLTFDLASQKLLAINDSAGIDENLEEGDGTRFLSVDPLAEKYPSVSPYAYVGNSPITFIDPDGRKITLYYLTGKFDKNGKPKYASWVYGENKKIPNNEYIRQTVASIKEIKNVDVTYDESVKDPNSILNEMVNDKSKNIKVFQTESFRSPYHINPISQDGGELTLKQAFSAVSTTVFNNPKIGLEVLENNAYIPNSAILWHELIHAYSFLYETKDYLFRRNPKNPHPDGAPNGEEYNAKKHEDNFLKYYGIGSRPDYNSEVRVFRSVSSIDNHEAVSPSNITGQQEIKLDVSDRKW